MFKGNVTFLLSDTFIQVTFGAGLPTAIQYKFRVVTSLPTITVSFMEMLVMLGGSTKLI